MCHLRNIPVAMRDYKESGLPDRHTDRWMDRMIPMCRYALQATQKPLIESLLCVPINRLKDRSPQSS